MTSETQDSRRCMLNKSRIKQKYAIASVNIREFLPDSFRIVQHPTFHEPNLNIRKPPHYPDKYTKQVTDFLFWTLGAHPMRTLLPFAAREKYCTDAKFLHQQLIYGISSLRIGILKEGLI